MTLEEKLQNFYDYSLQTAMNETNHIINEHKKNLEQLFLEHKELKSRQAAAELQAEEKKLLRNRNKEISSEQLRIKRALSQKQNQLKDQLFEEVRQLLNQFRTSSEYPAWLSSEIQKIKIFSEADPVTIYLDPDDQKYAEHLEQNLNIPLTISEERFGGGIRAVIPSRNILIDNSFDRLWSEKKESFTFNGGISHE